MKPTAKELAQTLRCTRPSREEAIADVLAKVERLQRKAPGSYVLRTWRRVLRELEKPEYE